jgi:hypothetical protein
MFDDFKEDVLKSMPIEYTRLIPLKTKVATIEDMHSLGCFTAIDLFNFSKKEKQDTPALFIIPYDRKLFEPRFRKFLAMTKQVDLVVDDTEKDRYGCMHILCKFTNTLSKDIAVPIIKGMLKDVNAPYYSFVSETWVVQQKKPYNREQDGMPSEHPDKKEKLIICTSDPSQNIMTMKDIEDNKLTGGGDYQKTKADISVGRFSNLFQDDSEQTRH